MFICSTDHVTDPGKKMFKVVTERRDRIYLLKKAEYDFRGNLITPEKTSKGWEIVKEEPFCEECLKERTGLVFTLLTPLS